MSQLKKVAEPFGAVSLYPAGDGHIRVVATFLLEPGRQGIQAGKIFDPAGKVLQDYSNTGLPLQLDFLVPSGASFFTLEIDGKRVQQPLFDDAPVPSSQLLRTAHPSVKESLQPAQPKINPPAGPIMIERTSEKRKRMAELNEMESPRTIPLWELNLEEESKKEEWTDFDLRVSDKDDGTGPEPRDKKTT